MHGENSAPGKDNCVAILGSDYQLRDIFLPLGEGGGGEGGSSPPSSFLPFPPPPPLLPHSQA
jgi:hypothetical protein